MRYNGRTYPYSFSSSRLSDSSAFISGRGGSGLELQHVWRDSLVSSSILLSLRI